MVSPLDALLLIAAAALGGALNSVAGGGSFFTFPALLLTGVPPIAANATSAVALWPGSVASAAGYREELRHERRLLLVFGAACVVGGVAGAIILLRTPERTFTLLVPFLLLAATLIFAFGAPLTRRLRARAAWTGTATAAELVSVALVLLVVATYGGYFGGGMGFLILAALAAMGMESVHHMNGLKAILGTVINGVAIVAFVLAGVVEWAPALLMTLGSIAGGYAGARYAKRVDAARVRGFVIAMGALLTVYFFWRTYTG